MELNDAADLLASLGQPTRLAVFRTLIAAGPTGMAAGDIADTLGVAAPTLSFHLSHLARVGLIHGLRRQRKIIYAVQVDRVRSLMGFLTDDCCQGRPEMCGGGFARASRSVPEKPGGGLRAFRLKARLKETTP